MMFWGRPKFFNKSEKYRTSGSSKFEAFFDHLIHQSGCIFCINQRTMS
eukprot:UN08580